MVTRANLPEPKTIENGVVVPPALQVNEMSIAEWRNRTTFDAAYARYSRAQLIDIARSMGFTEAEIEHEFRSAASEDVKIVDQPS